MSIAAASPAPSPYAFPGLPRPARLTTAILAISAAGIHLVLTPEHFRERTVYGFFFLIASAFQIVLGWLLIRRARAAVYRAGAWGSLALIGTWIVTRAVAPPFSPEGRPEPVTLLGILATGAELAALVLLATALPLPAERRRGAQWAWGCAAGAGFAALFLISSGAVSYTSLVTSKFSSIDVALVSGSLQSPLLFGMLLPHVWLVGSLPTFVLIAVAAVLLGVNVAASLDRPPAGGARLPPRRTVLALAPTMFAVSSCCGASTALFLGVAAVGPLFAATPWILLATAVMLAVNLYLIRRR